MKADKKNARKGQGHIYRRGEIYWMQYTVEGRRARVSLGTANLDEAKAERNRVLGAVPRTATREQTVQALVHSLDTDQASIPLDEVWDRWTKLTHRAPSAHTLKGYRVTWDAFLAWVALQPGGPKDVNAVMRKHEGLNWAERFKIHLDGRNLAPSTFNQYLGTLRNFWDTLRAPQNPWRQLKLKKLTHRIRAARKHSAFTMPEIQRILATATGDLKTLIEIGIYTGQRLFDCAHLRWDAIDTEHNVIRITQRKTGKLVVIPILPPLKAALATRPRDAEFVIPDMAACYDKDRAAPTKRFRDVLDACGIDASKVPAAGSTGRNITDKSFHSLRHTFVTECRKLGFEEAHIAAIVGHESLEMTRHYTDIGESEMVRLSERLGSPASAAPPTAVTLDQALAKMRSELNGMDQDNWTRKRRSLLEILDALPVSRDQVTT